MGSTKLLVTGAVIAVVGAAAILIPGIAAGVPLAGINPVSTVVAPEDGPGNNGRGNAFGHDRDSGDFPGNHKGDDTRDDSDHEGGGNGAWTSGGAMPRRDRRRARCGVRSRGASGHDPCRSRAPRPLRGAPRPRSRGR